MKVLVTGVALIFAATGTLNMAVLPERLAELPEGVRLGLNLLRSIHKSGGTEKGTD